MNQDEINDYIDKNSPYEICDFNDECDRCGNPNHKQSWVKMSGYPAEADYYICEDCALEAIKSRKSKDKWTR